MIQSLIIGIRIRESESRILITSTSDMLLIIYVGTAPHRTGATASVSNASLLGCVGDTPFVNVVFILASLIDVRRERYKAGYMVLFCFFQEREGDFACIAMYEMRDEAS